MTEIAIDKGLFDGPTLSDDISNAKGFWTFTDGPRWGCLMFEYGTRMHVIRSTGGTLSGAVEKAVRDNPKIKLVITGCFQDRGSDISSLMGQIIEEGQPPRGNPRPTRACLSYQRGMQAESSPYYFGIGDPSLGRGVGLGGLCPMLLKDPSGLPSQQTFLTDPFFQVSDNLPRETGRTIIARSSSKSMIVAIVQPHGSSKGDILSVLMSKLRAAGADDAVSLDGSDSVFFYYNGSWLVGPPPFLKNMRNVTAVGFSQGA